MTRLVSQGVLLAVALASTGCWSADRLPPPAAPAQEMPPVRAELGPLPTGRQWVILDTPGDTASVNTSDGMASHPVTRVDRTDSGFVREFPLVCAATPCAIDLHAATQTLRLTSTTNPKRVGVIRLQLAGDHDDGKNAAPDAPPVITLAPSSDPLVVRYVLPELQRGRGHTAFYALSGAGAFALLLGALVTPVSVTTSGGDRTMEGVGIGAIGLGAALLAVGISLSYMTRGTYTPGAVTSWTMRREAPAPPPAPPPPPATLEAPAPAPAPPPEAPAPQAP